MSAKDEGPRTLDLEQPQRLRRHFLLLENDVERGRLTFLKTLGSLAEAECGGKRYTLKRGGFLHPFISIRGAELGEEIAVLRIEWGWTIKGTLELNNGQSFKVLGPSLRNRRWALTYGDIQVATFRTRASLLTMTGTCQLRHDRKDIEPLLLLLIGWYFIIMALEEQS